ncbi:MAG: hypothetical protein QNJ65_16850 [Xenococcaceae cyanobacterium MO_234.B1]|nr:hypothetical protein [Xenococcaceae cyanobacterium MO_234.B1]
MNRNQRRQRAISRLGLKNSHCHRPQSSRTNRGEGEQQENWAQLRNRRREQYRQLPSIFMVIITHKLSQLFLEQSSNFS